MVAEALLFAVIAQGPRLIELYVHDDMSTLSAVCQSNSVIGCAEPKADKCTAHILRPGIGFPQDFYLIGHELWHCWFPGFHK